MSSERNKKDNAQGPIIGKVQRGGFPCGPLSAFAFGTMIVFAMLHRFVAHDIQQRTDAWLSGEVNVLGDVAERTPKDRLYRRVVGEVAELASREVPNKLHSSGAENDSVFFIQVSDEGQVKLWVGKGDGTPILLRSAPPKTFLMCLTICMSKGSTFRSAWHRRASETEAISILGSRRKTNGEF